MIQYHYWTCTRYKRMHNNTNMSETLHLLMSLDTINRWYWHADIAYILWSANLQFLGGIFIHCMFRVLNCLHFIVNAILMTPICNVGNVGILQLNFEVLVIITQPVNQYSLHHPTEGRRLSRPVLLVTYWGGLPAHRRSSISVLTVLLQRIRDFCCRCVI